MHSSPGKKKKRKKKCNTDHNIKILYTPIPFNEFMRYIKKYREIKGTKY